MRVSIFPPRTLLRCLSLCAAEKDEPYVLDCEPNTQPLTLLQEPEPSASPQSSQSPEPEPQRRRITPPASPSAASSDNDNYAGPANNASHSDRAVKNLVRLALACEYQRRPLRRTDISEKVLNKNDGRSFKRVFAAAQQQLRAIFGMELVELPAREKVTLQQKRAAQKSTSQGAKAPTQWILVSILPAQFRDPAILPPVPAPTAEAEGTYTGLYTLLVALIMLGGGQIPQAKLERYIRRLGIEDRTPVAGSEKTEKLLKRLEREGYIREIREKAMQGEEDVSFIVGPRGKVEVGRVGVEGLVKAVYSLGEREDEEELERRIARSLGVEEGVGRPPGGEGRRKKERPRQDAEEEGSGSGSEDEEGDELYE